MSNLSAISNAELLKHELHLYKELFNQLDIENKNKKQVNETKHTDINCTYTALAFFLSTDVLANFFYSAPFIFS
jgi:hypothetical protein